MTGPGRLGGLETSVPLVGKFGQEMERRTDADLAALTTAYRERIGNGEPLDSLLPEAFALVGEATHRTLGERQSNAQLLAGVALHHGAIVKIRHARPLRSLTVILPAYLNALTGRGVHVVAIADHLAERDVERMGPVYRYLGLEVGAIAERLSVAARRTAYAADLTYGGYEVLVHDFLRDDLALTAGELLQRGHAMALVDEADNILVARADNQMFLSGPGRGEEAVGREIWASISLRSYFNYYDKLAGMSGHIADPAMLGHSYRCEVLHVPAGQPGGAAGAPGPDRVVHPLVKPLLTLGKRKGAARRVEWHKRMIAIDEVMAQQRESFSGIRRRVLHGRADDVHEQAIGLLRELVSRAVERYCPHDAPPRSWDLDGLFAELSGTYPVRVAQEDVDLGSVDQAGLWRLLIDDAERALEARRSEVNTELGGETFDEVERAILLNLLSDQWRQHLRDLTPRRDRAIRREQLGWSSPDKDKGKDSPLADYQREADELFRERQRQLAREAVNHLFNARVQRTGRA